MANTRTSTAFIVIFGAWALGCGDGMTPPDPSAPVPIANSPEDDGICNLAVDKTHIFYRRGNGDVIRIHKATMSSIVLFPSTESRPFPLTVDESFVYWSEDQSLYRMPRSGGPPLVLAENQAFLIDIALTPDRVYFSTTNQEGSVKWVPKSGGPLTTIFPAENDHFRQLAMDSQDVYFINDWTISRIPLDGGTSINIVPDNSLAANDIALDETSLYYVGYDANFVGLVGKVPKDGSTPMVLFTEEKAVTDVSRIVMDDRYVYWTGQNSEMQGRIMRVPKDGGALTIVYEFPKGAKGTPCAIAMDEQYIYWGMLNARGLYRMAKPQ